MASDIESYDRLPQYDVEVEGFGVHLVDAGEGDAVVLVHGSPISSFAFRQQIAALSQKFRVIAPDLLGFGQSEAPPGGTAFRQQAMVLRGLLEQVSKLVLMNTSIRPELSPPWYWWPLHAPVLGDLLVVHLNIVGLGLPTAMRSAWGWQLYRRYLAMLRRVDTRRTVLQLERLTGYRELMIELQEVLPAFHVPTLVLWGEGDPYFRRSEIDHFTSLFPHAQVQMIPKGGHFPQEDAPRAVTDALAAFLEAPSL